MFMRLLRSAAQKHGLCILVCISPSLRPCIVARPVSADGEVLLPCFPHKVLNDATAAGRPALGASFTFMTDATLWLERAPGPQDRELRTAEVLRSRVSVRRAPSFFFSPAPRRY